MAEYEKLSVRREESGTETDYFVRNWFCVALTDTGTIFKQDAESPEEFIHILEHCVIGWVDCVTEDFSKEVMPAATRLGFSDLLANSFLGEHLINYQDFGTEMGMLLPSIQIRHFEVTPYPLLFFVRRSFILTVHPRNVDRRFTRLRRYADTFIRKIPLEDTGEDKLTKLLIRIIDVNNDSNFGHLRQIEERGDELNESLMDPATPRDILGPKIYEMKHALLTYLDGLWQTVDVLHALRYGDADLISDDAKLLERLGMVASDVQNQIGLAEHMSEVLASGMEVLQSIYNNQLQLVNNRLSLVITYLTIIGTAFLVPNTLATILGNSVFQLTPNDLPGYIALMIGSTVVATLLATWWVVRSGWLPKRSEKASGQQQKTESKTTRR